MAVTETSKESGRTGRVWGESTDLVEEIEAVRTLTDKTASADQIRGHAVIPTGRHGSLAEALAAFHLERPNVIKDSENTDFGNKYASLNAFEAVVLPLLAKHGLTWTCLPSLSVRDDAEPSLALTWRLIHAASGEELTGVWPLVQGTPQAIGSSLTYAKRYLLSAVTGVSAEDDDNGEAASRAVEKRQQRKTPEDWGAVLAQAALATSIPDLRKLYAREGVKGAPDDVQAAFTVYVNQLQAAVDPSRSADA